MPQRRSTTEVVDGRTSRRPHHPGSCLNEGRRPKSSTVHGDGAAVGEDDVASTKVDDRSRRRHRSWKASSGMRRRLNEGRRPKSSTDGPCRWHVAGGAGWPQRRSTTEVVDGIHHGDRWQEIGPQRRSTTEVVDGCLRRALVMCRFTGLNEGRRPKSSTVDQTEELLGLIFLAPQRRSTTEVVDGRRGGRSRRGRGVAASTKVDDRSRRREYAGVVERASLGGASTKVDDRSRRRQQHRTGDTRPHTRLNEGRRPKSSTADVLGDNINIAGPQRRSTTEVVDGCCLLV